MSNKRSGFTLIEIVIALSILTIGIISLTALLTVGLAAFSTSQDITVASLKAQEKLEELKRNGVDSLATPPVLPSEGSFSSPTQFDDNPRFSYSVAVSYIDDGTGTNTAIDGLREVIVRVTWTRFQRQYSEDYITYISKR